jgi:hypothetical protein
MPTFDQPTRVRLLGSIEAGHLMLLCGAGLSMPAPSNLMSAAGVARACYDKWYPTEQLPAPSAYDELAAVRQPHADALCDGGRA